MSKFNELYEKTLDYRDNFSVNKPNKVKKTLDAIIKSKEEVEYIFADRSSFTAPLKHDKHKQYRAHFERGVGELHFTVSDVKEVSNEYPKYPVYTIRLKDTISQVRGKDDPYYGELYVSKNWKGEI